MTLFFDAGGTLLHPREAVGTTYAEVARRFGVELDPVRVEQGFRRTFKARKLRAPGTIPADGEDRDWWREAVRLTLSDSVLPTHFPFEAYFAELYEVFAESDRWSLYPEVVESLEILYEKGFSMAIISNWDSRLRRVLEGHRLQRFFSGIYISAELGVAKPEPRIYEQALQGMKVSTCEALMIGDDQENDSEAVLRLGWRSFLLKRPENHLGKLLEILI